jgi:hypothetical protein
MRNGFVLGGFLISFLIALLVANPVEADSKVYYGQVVGIEFTVIQVRGDNDRISVFWLGYKTSLDSRLPFFGDRVRVEYIKDALGRNAVTRIAVLKKH